MARRVRSTKNQFQTSLMLSDVQKRLQELQRLMHDSSDHEGSFLKEPRPSVLITNHGSKLWLRRGSSMYTSESIQQYISGYAQFIDLLAYLMTKVRRGHSQKQ